MDKEQENQKQNEVQEVKKENFEPLEIEVVDVQVEKGYATSGHNDPVTIQQWKDGNW